MIATNFEKEAMLNGKLKQVWISGDNFYVSW